MSKRLKKNRFVVWIPEDLIKKFNEYCEKKGICRSRIVEKILNEYLITNDYKNNI